MNLSFAGCGFLGIYHVGVAVCFKKYAPHLLLHKISGASAGALAATCLLCDLPLGEMTSDFFRVVKEARSYPLGPFSPSFDIQMSLIEGLTKFLPDDAHERVNGKLNISLTRVYDGKNVIVSHFQSRHDLLQALLCACFIPGFSGILPPRLYGVRYMDGAFSDNLPILDENTITVSPFCGESDICPRDDSAQFFHLNWANTSIELSKQNISRFARILYPPPPEALSIVLKHGYEDALKYLQKNNLINCTRCLSVQSTFLVQESASFDTDDFDPECDECIKYRTDALIGTIPDTVVTVMQTNINSANSGLANWIYKHPSVNFLKILSLPCILPADIFCATLTNIIGDSYEQKLYEYEVVANIIKSSSKKPILPKHYHKNNHKEVCNNNRIFGVKPNLTENVRAISKYILNQLYAAIISKKKITSNLHCELSITESGKATPKQFIHRTSTIDLKIDESKLIKSKTDVIPILNQTSSNENNTFDHILQVTSNQEAVYAYYYMDESNKKVKITEIYDLSDDDSPALQTFEEHEINENLEFDNDWNDNSTSSDTMYEDIGDDEPYYKNMIDVGDIIEDYNIFNSCNNNVDNSSSNINKNYNNDKHIKDASWPALQIEEITNDSCDDEQSLITNNASAALRRPSPHSIIY